MTVKSCGECPLITDDGWECRHPAMPVDEQVDWRTWYEGIPVADRRYPNCPLNRGPLTLRGV